MSGTPRISSTDFKNLNCKSMGAQLVRKRQTEEEDLQMACVSWVELHLRVYPILKWMFHTPNGGKRSKAEAGRFKAMGVKSGVPDLLLNARCGKWAGFAIELKSSTGAVSDDQVEWIQHYSAEGYLVILECRTIDAFITAVKRFLSGV
ncbi:VRR-NUC domain-containing protein [Chromobacterium fluminis]|nr:VRR-NUC domain-containing protein [Chromobacterium haemolyticum]